MMEFAESFEYEADDMMAEIMAESDAAASPTLTPFVGLGSTGEAMLDGPTTARQAEAKDLFATLDDGKPSVARLKRIGMHHDEAFEL
jgi:hypothetical protein